MTSRTGLDSSWTRRFPGQVLRGLAAVVATILFALSPTVALAQADASPETTGDFNWWLPVDVSTTGAGIDAIFNVILWITSVVFVGVFGVMLYYLIRYRYQAGRSAIFVHGNNRLETVWTLIPALILALIAVFSQSTWSQIKSYDSMPQGDDVIHVDVIGRQFAWYFHYPGEDGEFGPRRMDLVNPQSTEPGELIGLDRNDPRGKDDLIAAELYLPVNRQVRMRVTSVDVIHSFFLPNFRIKQDTVPGLNAQVWLEATRTSAEVIGRFAGGDPKPFDIVCAELCGQAHFKMKGSLYVVSQQEFEAFLEREAAFLPSDDDPFAF